MNKNIFPTFIPFSLYVYINKDVSFDWTKFVEVQIIYAPHSMVHIIFLESALNRQ